MSKTLGVRAKVVLPIIVLGGVLGVVAAIHVMNLSKELITETAEKGAALMVAQTAELRRYYTANVVARAKAKGMVPTWDFTKDDNSIPLPATMVHEMNDKLSADNDFQIRLYSAFPFPHRAQTGGARDAFEKDALE